LRIIIVVRKRRCGFRPLRTPSLVLDHASSSADQATRVSDFRRGKRTAMRRVCSYWANAAMEITWRSRVPNISVVRKIWT